MKRTGARALQNTHVSAQNNTATREQHAANTQQMKAPLHYVHKSTHAASPQHGTYSLRNAPFHTTSNVVNARDAVDIAANATT
jgi:hypothetical protein